MSILVKVAQILSNRTRLKTQAVWLQRLSFSPINDSCSYGKCLSGIVSKYLGVQRRKRKFSPRLKVIEPRSPALQADSLPAEPQGKPKNIEVGSLSLLQQIFPTQESNWGFLHCRWILYQLSYQGKPRNNKYIFSVSFHYYVKVFVLWSKKMW